MSHNALSTYPTASSSSTTSPPPYADSKTLTSSISSTSTSPSYTTATTFTPTQVFQINTLGKHSSDYYSFPAETDIPITSQNHEPFRSVRTHNTKGNSDLFFAACPSFSSDDLEKTPRPNAPRQLAAQTTYRFTPGKHATVAFYPLSQTTFTITPPQPIEEIEIRSKCMSFSNSIVFTSPRFGRFIWRYADRKERKAAADKGKVDSLVVLEQYVGEKETVQVARLVRGEETRTPGSRRWNTEGNGGVLEVDLRRMGLGEKGQGAEGEMEALVLSTCLVVLKREIDRLGLSQAVVLS